MTHYLSPATLEFLGSICYAGITLSGAHMAGKEESAILLKQWLSIVRLPFTAVLAVWLLGYFLLSYALAFGVVLAIGAVALVVEAVGSFLHTAFRRKSGE